MFTALTKTAMIILGISIMTTLFFLLPFKIALPNEIYNFFIDGSINSIFKTLNYLVPLNFMLGVLTYLLALRYFNIWWGIINWIWGKIFHS